METGKWVNIWETIDIFRFLGGDIGFLWAMMGHCGSAVTTFPSPVCLCAKENLVDCEQPCPLRSIAQTMEHATAYSAHLQQGQQPSKEIRATTKGIVANPILQCIPFSNVLLATLHCFQGLGNDLIRALEKEDSSQIEQVMPQFLKAIGARREAFRKRDFPGNTIHKLLSKADQLRALFPLSEWAQSICDALEVLGRIQQSVDVKMFFYIYF